MSKEMIGRLAFILSAALFSLAGAPLPAAAQEETAYGNIGLDPEIEPLTEEQRARLPLAWELVALLVPDDAALTSLGLPFGGIFGRGLDEAPSDPRDLLIARLNYVQADLDISEQDARAALAILDPDWEERERAEREAMRQLMQLYSEYLTPLMREGYAEAFAAEFDEQVLRDAAAFYSSESGQIFGPRSLSLGTHPRVIMALSRSFEDPAMFEALQAQAETLQLRTETFASPLTYDDLSPDQLSQLSTLTGMTVAEIDAAMNYDWEEEFWDDDAGIESAADAASAALEEAD